MLYHASSVKGLRVLQPRVSTHKKSYVYAINNPITAVLFGAKHDDFDFILDEEEGIPALYECYPGAFERVYQNKACSLYAVEEAGFLSGMTSWAPEYVCESPAKVISETQITDLYGYLLACAGRGELVVHFYQQTPDYRRMVANHIVDRLLRFEMDLDGCLRGEDKRFALHYEGLIRALMKILDGDHLA